MSLTSAYTLETGPFDEIWATRSVQGNARLDLLVRPKLVRAVHQSEGFAFPSTDRVTR